MKATVARSLLLLVLVAVSKGAAAPPPPPPPPGLGVPNTPPPLSEFQKQQGEPEEKPESPRAPPSLSVFQNSPQTGNSAPDRSPAVRPTPGLARPDGARWDLPEGDNPETLANLEDPSILNDIVYDVNVGKKGLTAVKDEELQACFVDHYIMPFIVPREQRRFYTHTLPGVLVDGPKDRYAYKSLVGAPIYNMCHRFRTYWLDNGLMYRFNSMLQDLSAPSSAASNNRAFPPGLANQRVDDVRRPPPVSLYHVQQQHGRGSNTDGFRPSLHLAPPPLAEYQRLHPQP